MNSNVNVIEYEGKYRQSVCLLFVQLQQHLVDIDPEHVQTIYEPYYNKYCDYVLNFLKHNSGKMYLAMDDGIIVGLVAGYVEEKDEEDKLTNRCPIRGVVSELVVDLSLIHISRFLLKKLKLPVEIDTIVKITTTVSKFILGFRQKMRKWVASIITVFSRMAAVI